MKCCALKIGFCRQKLRTAFSMILEREQSQINLPMKESPRNAGVHILRHAYVKLIGEKR